MKRSGIIACSYFHPPPPPRHLFTSFTLAKTLDLGNNRVKNFGVEAMSCAVLGQDHKDHRSRQRRARRQQQHNRTTLDHACSAALPNAAAPSVHREHAIAIRTRSQQYQPQSVPHSRHNHAEKLTRPNHHYVEDCEYNLPPIAGTPLFAAATARVRGCASIGSRAAVTLDHNLASASVMKGQRALSGLGEAALLRGCVLPESVLHLGIGSSLNTWRAF